MLTLLTTYGLRGDLDRLPRLHRFLAQLRAEHAASTVRLLDLGASCDPAVWPCTVTGGRATLIALDAMGYHAANVAGVLDAASRDRLAAQVTLALVDGDHPYTEDGLRCFVGDPAPQDDSARLHIDMNPAAATTLTGGVLRLAGVEPGQVGVTVLNWEPESAPELHSLAVRAVPSTTAPDPTIAGVIDFIRAEARHYAQRQDRT